MFNLISFGIHRIIFHAWLSISHGPKNWFSSEPNTWDIDADGLRYQDYRENTINLKTVV